MLNKVLIVFVFLTLSTLSFGGSIQFTPFIQKQMQIAREMNDANGTQESIQKLLEEQEVLYDAKVKTLMRNKTEFIKRLPYYDKEVFSLKKVMGINKRAGNTYAYIRDRVALQTYKLLQNENELIRSVLSALNEPSMEEFETLLNQIVATYQEKNAKLSVEKYKDILDVESQSTILKAAQANIHDFYTLKYVSSDLISYLYKYRTKMYRLNKYEKYNLISFVLYLDSFKVVSIINPVLEHYNLNVMKIICMLFLVLLMYLLKKFFYYSLEKYIFKIAFLQKYATEISEQILGMLGSFILIVNINMIIYVYNDFSSVETTNRLFNMIYGFYFTFVIYKIINAIAKVQLDSLRNDSSNVQNDLINVGIKIINFIIIIIGLLIVLFFGGVDLTAVLSGLGIGGFAVAFAAKDTISNFFGTLSILFSDVFSQGDWIEIDSKQGVVVEIGLRVTTIRTFDNALIAIPNGTFASKDVKNWNKRILGRRIKMHIGVKYDSGSEDIKNAVNDIREMLDKHPSIATKDTKYTHRNEHRHSAKLVSKDDLEGVKKNLFVFLDNFGDSSINILIYCFTKSVVWAEWLETKEDIMHKIMEILQKNNLEFAFPSLSIYNENEIQHEEK